MENTKISIIAILIPNILAFSSLYFQYLMNRSNQVNEKLKLFYKDRLDSFRDLNQQLMKIIQAIEFIRNTRRVFTGKYSLNEIFDNKSGSLPNEVSGPFKLAVYNSTIMARDEYAKIVETNQLFISEKLSRLLKEVEVQYFYQIPQIFEINQMVEFVENKLETLKELKKSINTECKIIIGVK